MDSEYSIDGRIIPTLNGFKKYENGGKGSGNFGHGGRLGKRGGSARRTGVNESREEYDRADISRKDKVKDILDKTSASGYLEEQIKNDYPDDVIDDLYRNLDSLADLSDRRLEEVYRKREKMYSSKDDFDKANQWLGSIIGNGKDILEKAKILEFDPSKEISLSKSIMEEKGETSVYRNQSESSFRKKGNSRWGDMPNTHTNEGALLKSIVNSDNILIHPEVLYSGTNQNYADRYYRNEREYVLDNSRVDID